MNDTLKSKEEIMAKLNLTGPILEPAPYYYERVKQAMEEYALQQREQPWVRVEDGLPDQFEDVLVWLKHEGFEIGRVLKYEQFYIYWNRGRTLNEGFGNCPEVTHWMKISPPAPPKD